MSIIIQQLTYEHPDRVTLFRDLSLSILQGEKSSIIGDNGTGKSTLLKILGEDLPLKSGTIHTDSKPYYVPQHFGQYDDMTIAEALSIDVKLKALQAIIEGDASNNNFEKLNDDWQIEEKIKLAFSEWNLRDKHPDNRMKNLSGGEKTKVFLAGISIHNASIILLDEPTNHLDFANREQLYKLIEKLSATILIVSHDRTLLNLLSHTYELSQLGIKYYAGNYDDYEEQKGIETSALISRIESKEKELKSAQKTKQEIVERRQKLDARGKQKGRKMGLGKMALKIRQDRAEKTTSKLKNTHIEKVESIHEDMAIIQGKIDKTKKLKIGFHSSDLHKGKILCKAKDLNFSYDSSALWASPLDFRVCSGDRVLLKGSNGSGKTTLLNLIIGMIRPTEGEMYVADFQHLYLDQDYSIILNHLTVYEQAQQYNLQMSESDVKMNLARSLFPSHTWDKPCSTLSGGEKMKLVLCCLIVSETTPDLIILDEPTNNIDLQSIKVLTASIQEYRGTVLLVSHDTVFLNQIGIDYEIEL